MSDEQAKEAWAAEKDAHDAYHTEVGAATLRVAGPVLGCPWCHGDNPTWEDYIALEGPEDAADE